MTKDSNFRATLRAWFEQRLIEKNLVSATPVRDMVPLLKRGPDGDYENYEIHLKWIECQAIYEWARDIQIDRDQAICENLELEMCKSTKPGTRSQKDEYHGIARCKKAIRNQFRQ